MLWEPGQTSVKRKSQEFQYELIIKYAVSNLSNIVSVTIIDILFLEYVVD